MKLAAQRRENIKPNKLRAQGLLPAVVYNKELHISISVDLKTFDKVFRDQGTSSLIELVVDGNSHDVLVKQVQMDKRRRIPMHADFYAVSADQPVDVYVHVEYTGTAAGVREGGLLDVQKREVLISVLPRYIPNHFEVDVSELTIGDALHVGAVQSQLPQGAEILDDLELALITVAPPRVEEEPEAILEEEAEEPEVIARGREEEEEE